MQIKRWIWSSLDEVGKQMKIIFIIIIIDNNLHIFCTLYI